MKLRKIMALALAMILCVATMSTLASCNNSSAKYTVGVLQLTQHSALDAATKGFKDALVKAFGEDVEIIEQNANGETTACTTIANDFVAKKVDLIMANATPALQAAAAATVDIPILGTSVTEYGVALEIKDFNGTVGGNISGTSDLAPLDEQAKMITDLFPNAQNVGLLFCSSEANSRYQVDVIKEKLTATGKTCTEYSFPSSAEVANVAAAAAAGSDVIYIPTDNTAADCTEAINNAIGNTPVIAGEPGICSGCGVATLGISYYDLGVKTGEMAVKILKNEAKISEMAIEYAPASKKYNKAKCDELGLTMPEDYTVIE